jgi:hypothetical protein
LVSNLCVGGFLKIQTRNTMHDGKIEKLTTDNCFAIRSIQFCDTIWFFRYIGFFEFALVLFWLSVSTNVFN